MTRLPYLAQHRHHRQKGIVMVVAMVMLVLITLLGLTSVRTLTVEEKMAANSYDRNLAFQSAETTLREAEAVAAAQAQPTNGAAPNAGFDALPAMACPPNDPNLPNNNTCANGLCSTPVAECNPRWENSGFTGWQNSAPGIASGLADNAPQYIIEYLGNTFPCEPVNASSPANCKRYRVTVRSNPGAGRASVMLQSIYATD